MKTKISNQRIFEVISRDKTFFRHYLNNYINRLINNNSDKTLILNAFLEFNNLDKTMYTDNILGFANIINQKSGKDGLRNYNLNNNFTSPKHELIYQKIYSTLDIYRGLWQDLSILEKEALLHIHLMRIYPFINNNELICSLILGSNLINSFYPPIIIEDKQEYYQIINSGDALKFKKTIENLAIKELKHIIDLYKKHYLFPENISIEEIIIQMINY